MELGLVKLKDEETESLADLILPPSEAGFKFDLESERRMKTVTLNGEQVLIPLPRRTTERMADRDPQLRFQPLLRQPV